MLRIAEVEPIKETLLPIYISASNTKEMYKTVIIISIAFSLFHFWDLAYATFLEEVVEKFASRFFTGFLYGMLYIISGQKIYAPVLLHYVNNVYANL